MKNKIIDELNKLSASIIRIRNLVEYPVFIRAKEELQAEMKAEARRIAMDDLIEEKIKADPYLSAMAGIQEKIESGQINENASRAIRDEIQKGKK